MNAHKAWISGANDYTEAKNTNHRAYPTIQLYKTKLGVFSTPCYIEFWVWLDMPLETREYGVNDWFSFATFTDDSSDDWARTNSAREICTSLTIRTILCTKKPALF
ncbi:MAG: hypothetical protein PF481_06395 [Bacteroidales bacterium]|nr:hypothetical protein [Bacteroidales bacterium]